MDIVPIALGAAFVGGMYYLLRPKEVIEGGDDNLQFTGDSIETLDVKSSNIGGAPNVGKLVGGTGGINQRQYFTTLALSDEELRTADTGTMRRYIETMHSNLFDKAGNPYTPRGANRELGIKEYARTIKIAKDTGALTGDEETWYEK